MGLAKEVIELSKQMFSDGDKLHRAADKMAMRSGKKGKEKEKLAKKFYRNMKRKKKMPKLRKKLAVTESERLEKEEKKEELRTIYRPIVEQMNQVEAVAALRWGHMLGSDLAKLRKEATLVETFRTIPNPKPSDRRRILDSMEKITDKNELIEIILSIKHPDPRFQGLPQYVPRGLVYRAKERKLLELLR